MASLSYQKQESANVTDRERPNCFEESEVVLTRCPHDCGGRCILRVHVKNGLIIRIENDAGDKRVRCPMEALDLGSLSQLRGKYGETKVAEGFIYSSKMKPSIIFKSKSPE
jgi:hypothetical protein